MKLFKIYLIIFISVVTFIGVSRFFSPFYEVKESIIIAKPAPVVFGYLSNMKNWEQWSLWNTDADSSLHFFYSQQPIGVGAKQYINSVLMGNGHIETTIYKPDSMLGYKMIMQQGDMTANGIFRLAVLSENETELSWIDTGNVGNNPIKRYLIPMLTKNTSENFKQGLQRIKANIEKE
jgi:hypothetical protein